MVALSPWPNKQRSCHSNSNFGHLKASIKMAAGCCWAWKRKKTDPSHLKCLYSTTPGWSLSHVDLWILKQSSCQPPSARLVQVPRDPIGNTSWTWMPHDATAIWQPGIPSHRAHRSHSRHFLPVGSDLPYSRGLLNIVPQRLTDAQVAGIFPAFVTWNVRNVWYSNGNQPSLVAFKHRVASDIITATRSIPSGHQTWQ